MLKDAAFYDLESAKYSSKRYPRIISSYTQSFYRSRLHAVHRLLRAHKEGGSLLEIGCADGYVLTNIYDAFVSRFQSFRGIDISSAMIEEAKRKAGDRRIDFQVRTGDMLAGEHSVVLEVGVLNYLDPETEFAAVRAVLATEGRYICSVAGNDSLFRRLKPREETGFRSDESYATYETVMKKHFAIQSATPVGFFIPHLWKVPALARIVQPVVEVLLRAVLPNLFHEKVYVLTPRV